MTEKKDSYRQIMKATSVFGGVQVFQILISIIRSKFVAVLLGPTGMGVVGLLTTTTGLVNGLTNFGLGTIAVKSISEATNTGDEKRISTVVTVLRRMVWISGLLGALVTLVFSPWLSEFTFGNREYTLPFIWISVTLLLNQLTTGELVTLQALRRIQHLAKANLYGSLVGLFVTVPLYYLFGMDGIVPVIIITAFITFFFAWYFARKIKLEKVTVSGEKTIAEGKSMMGTGFIISLSGLVALITGYLVRIYINHTGSVDDVGFYTAGFTLINTYVGMIFTAMGTDYFSGLSRVASDNGLCRESINQQSEIALLLLAPILIVFLVFVNLAVLILYSSEFLVISGMIYWAALGIFFKAVSWAIAFVFLAKGEGKLYFWNELGGSLYMLIFGILGFRWGGLDGLGFAFMVSYIVYLIQVFIIAKVKYNFSFHSVFKKIFAIQFLLALLTFGVVHFIERPYSYLIGILLIAVSSWYSFRELEKRIGIKELTQNFIRKIKRK